MRNLSLKEIFILGVSLLIFYFVFFPTPLFYLPLLRFLCVRGPVSSAAYSLCPHILPDSKLQAYWPTMDRMKPMKLRAHINLSFLEVVQLRHFVTMTES